MDTGKIKVFDLVSLNVDLIDDNQRNLNTFIADACIGSGAAVVGLWIFKSSRKKPRRAYIKLFSGLSTSQKPKSQFIVNQKEMSNL